MDKGIKIAILVACMSLFVVLGLGLNGSQLAYGQTNIRFSTWHVPVGYEVKTVWEPMLETLKEEEQWTKLPIPCIPEVPWARARSIMTSSQRVFRIWGTLRPPGPRSISPDGCPLLGRLGGR